MAYVAGIVPGSELSGYVDGRRRALALPARAGSSSSSSRSSAPLVIVRGEGDSSAQIRRAFRHVAGVDRATMVRHLSRETGIDAADLSQLGDDDLAGLSLKKLTRGIKHIASPVQKLATKVGHAAGAAVTSKIGKGILAAGLAATGVGIGASAAIMGGSQFAGRLAAKGGNLKRAARAGAIGAATGAAAGVAGKIIASKLPSVTTHARDVANKILPGNPFKRAAIASTPTAASTALRDLAPVAAAGGGIAALKPTLTPSGELPSALQPIAEIGTPLAKRARISAPHNPLTTALANRDGSLSRDDQQRAKQLAARKKSPLSLITDGSGDVDLEQSKRIADATLTAGSKAKAAANKAADQVDRLNAKIAKLKSALAKAHDVGDAIGANAITQEIDRAQGIVSNVSSNVSATGDALRTAGDAAQGAAAGAVGGAGAGAISQWIRDNKGIAIAGGAGAALVLYSMLRGPRVVRSSYVPASQRRGLDWVA